MILPDGHLAPDTIAVRVGDALEAGQPLAEMGNSGRSEVRHLHVEVGERAAPFDPCAPAQSFDAIYSPVHLGL